MRESQTEPLLSPTASDQWGGWGVFSGNKTCGRTRTTGKNTVTPTSKKLGGPGKSCAEKTSLVKSPRDSFKTYRRGR